MHAFITIISGCVRFANLFEEQINIFYRTDPDPLDDRHPLRTDSTCELGQLLRLITSHDSFFQRLTDYLCNGDDPYNSTVGTAARLLCSIHLGVTLSFTVGEAVSIFFIFPLFYGLTNKWRLRVFI